MLSTVLLWLPFILRIPTWFGLNFQGHSFLSIYQQFDGLLYIVPAKSWYEPKLIEKLGLEAGLPLEYFAAHLPLYPFFIRLFAFIGYLKSLVFVNILFTCFLALFFYYLLQKFELTKKPLLLVTVFLFLPRFFVVRTVGAPESLFMLLILLSLFFFEKKNYVLAGIFGGLSAMTKTPGILLFVAYVLTFFEQYLHHRKFRFSWLFILFIPLGLFGVFWLYLQKYGNFFAYFNTGGVVPLLYPFSVFNYQGKWIGTGWLEDIFFYFFMYGYSVLVFKDFKYRSFFYFSLVFFIATTFIQHRDISRYSLPLWPLACIALEQYFTSKKFFIVFLILLPGIFLYSWNFLLFNIMPVSIWQPYL